MSAVRGLVHISLVVACAATSFVTAQAYMVAKEEIALEKAAGAPTVQKLSDNGDPTKPLTPAMPTKKHALSAALKTLARKGAPSHAK